MVVIVGGVWIGGCGGIIVWIGDYGGDYDVDYDDGMMMIFIVGRGSR